MRRTACSRPEISRPCGRVRLSYKDTAFINHIGRVSTSWPFGAVGQNGGSDMFREKFRRERFWLVLGAALIALFVWQRETVSRPATERYDTAGMNRLVEKTVEIPVYVAHTRALPKPRPWRPATASTAPVPARRIAAERDDRIITGSIAPSPALPLARPLAGRGVQVASLEPAAPATRVTTVARYYVQLGSYESIDAATQRYLGLSSKKADLRGDEKIFIEEADVGGQRFHRVRMGAFASEREARAACARAGVAGSDCAVVAIN